MVCMAQRSRARKAGDPDWLARAGIPAFLAVEIPRRQASATEEHLRADRRNGAGESDLG